MSSYTFLLVTFTIALSPLILWKKYAYRRKRLPPPRWTWLFMDLFEFPHLLSFLGYLISNGMLSLYFIHHTLPKAFHSISQWDPFIQWDWLLTCLSTSITYQACHLLLNMDQPYFYFSHQRTWTSFSETSLHLLSQALKASLFLNTLYWCVFSWFTPFIHAIYIFCRLWTWPTFTLWQYLIHTFSFWHLLAIIWVQFLNLALWSFTEYVYDLMVTRQLTLTLTNADLIHALKRNDKPFLQDHAYYELLRISLVNELRRRSIFKEQPEHQTWSQLFKQCLSTIQFMDTQLTFFLTLPSPSASSSSTSSFVVNNPISTTSSTTISSFPSNLSMMAPKPSLPPPLQPNSFLSSSSSLQSKNKVWAVFSSLFTKLYSLLFLPSTTSNPYSSKISNFHSSPPSRTPMLPRNFTWPSTSTSSFPSSTSSPPANSVSPPSPSPSLTAFFSSLFSKTFHTYTSPWSLAFHQGFLALRLSFLVSEYQRVSWSMYALGSLFYHSKKEDPYGLVYPSLLTYLTTLFTLINRLETVMAMTSSYLSWSKPMKAMFIKHSFQSSCTPQSYVDFTNDTAVNRVFYMYEHAMVSLALIYHAFQEYIHSELIHQLSKENQDLFKMVLRQAEVMSLSAS